MRFSILGFRQSVAVEKGLVMKDLIFLRWFIDFWSTGQMHFVIVEKNLYFWVDNQKILDELPILGIAHLTNLRRFLRGLTDKQILYYHLEKNNRPFYRLNPELMSKLLCDTPRIRRKRK